MTHEIDETSKSSLERLVDLVSNYPDPQTVRSAVTVASECEGKHAILWQILVGDPEKGKQGGVLKTLDDLSRRLADLAEVVKDLSADVRGDGNGTGGLKIKVHDLEGATERLINWGKYIGTLVTINLLAVIAYLLKWWAAMATGG